MCLEAKGLSLWTSWRWWRTGRFIWFWAYGGAKFPKMWDFLPCMPMNQCAKFDTASFIHGGEIHNRTNTHTHTVNNISTPCLSACVDTNDCKALKMQMLSKTTIELTPPFCITAVHAAVLVMSDFISHSLTIPFWVRTTEQSKSWPLSCFSVEQIEKHH